MDAADDGPHADGDYIEDAAAEKGALAGEGTEGAHRVAPAATEPAFTASQIAAGKSLVKEEKREEGSVGVATYVAYVKAAGGFVVAFFVVIIFMISVLSKMFADFWLSYWLRQGDGKVCSSTSTLLSIDRYLFFFSLPYPRITGTGL